MPTLTSSRLPRRFWPCAALALFLWFAAGSPGGALAAGAGERTVTGTVREVSVSRRNGTFVIYVRLSGVGKRLWAPENHGDNLNTIREGDRFAITYRTATGEMLSRGTL